MGFHTLVSIKNNTCGFLICLPALASSQCVLINKKYFWAHIHAYQCCFLNLCFCLVSNLYVLFIQGRSVDLCPQMTQLPLNSLPIFTQALCSSVVWVLPVDLALNNMISGQVETEPPLLILYSPLPLFFRRGNILDHHTCLPWWTIRDDELLITNHKRRICCIGQLS